MFFFYFNSNCMGMRRLINKIIEHEQMFFRPLYLLNKMEWHIIIHTKCSLLNKQKLDQVI